MLRKLFFLGAMILAWPAAALAANPVVTIGSASNVNTNADVRISVTASGMTRLTDWNLKLAYDRDALTFLSVEKGTATQTWFYVDGSVSKGKLQLIGRNGSYGTPVAGDNQELCRITFRTRPDAFVTTVTLTPSSPGGEIRNAALNPGKITITTPPPLKLTVGHVSGQAGTQVIVPVTAEGMSASTAWSFDLSYDRNKLDFVSAAKGTSIKNWTTLTGTAKRGKAHIEAVAGSGAALSGVNLDLCKLTYYIVPGTATGSSLDLKISNCKLGLNGAKKSNGKITVTAPAR